MFLHINHEFHYQYRIKVIANEVEVRESNNHLKPLPKNWLRDFIPSEDKNDTKAAYGISRFSSPGCVRCAIEPFSVTPGFVRAIHFLLYILGCINTYSNTFLSVVQPFFLHTFYQRTLFFISLSLPFPLSLNGNHY